MSISLLAVYSADAQAMESPVAQHVHLRRWR
jgi:hypothetical protein